MKILALEKEFEGRTAADFEPHLASEARHAWDLYQKSIVREIYFRGDQKSAVIILECKTVDEAEAILADFPLVREKLIYFELIPLVPYPGFERLFR